MRHSKAALVLAAALCACQPGSVGGTRIPLEAGASRDCTGQMQVTVEYTVSDAGRGPPGVEPMTQSFTSTRGGGGYEFVQEGGTSMGPINLRASVRENGTVTEATLSGTGVAPMFSTSPEDMNRLAVAAANSIPERMLLGRGFNVGDRYYTDAMIRELVDAMSRSMGIPPTFNLNVDASDVKFAGLTSDSGAQAYVFRGTLHATGGGDFNGQNISLDYPAEVTVAYDPETGLMRSSSTDGVITTNLDGERQSAMRMQQTLTCTIRRA
ncbi:MAG: hypothetical protein AB7Q23_10785 [Hyphomonadaceae bacterium]